MTSIDITHKGSLKKFDYSPLLPQAKRRKALREAVLAYGKDSVIKKLNAIAVLTKNKQPEHSEIYRADLHYVEGLKTPKHKQSGSGMSLAQVNTALAQINVQSPLPKDNPNYPSVENAYRAWWYTRNFMNQLNNSVAMSTAALARSFINKGVDVVNKILGAIPGVDGVVTGTLSTANSIFQKGCDVLGIPSSTTDAAQIQQILQALIQFKQSYTPWAQLSDSQKQAALNEGFDPVAAVSALNNQAQNRPPPKAYDPTVSGFKDLPGLPGTQLQAAWSSLTPSQQHIFDLAYQYGPDKGVNYGQELGGFQWTNSQHIYTGHGLYKVNFWKLFNKHSGKGVASCACEPFKGMKTQTHSVKLMVKLSPS